MPEISADDDYAHVLAAYREDYHRLYAWRALPHGERIVARIRERDAAGSLAVAASALRTSAEGKWRDPAFIQLNAKIQLFPERAAVLAVMAFCVWVWGDEEKRKAGLPSR